MDGHRAGGLGELVGDPLAGGDRGVGDGGGNAVPGGEFVAPGEEGGDGTTVAACPQWAQPAQAVACSPYCLAS